MAIAKPPFTVDKLKHVLDFLKYYDITDRECAECAVKYQNLAHFYREHIQRNRKRRENVLRLFDYCETDYDRDLLQRRYIHCEDYFDIAYDIGYSEGAIYKHFKRALERLSENTKNIQEFEY